MENEELVQQETPPEALTGAATPLCGRCGGAHLAAECPTLTAGGEAAAIDDDAEGTR